MSDHNAHFHSRMLSVFQPDPATELEHARRQEARTAEAQAFHAMAYREMPEDLRTQAALWGVSALMEAVWMNAWEGGYKQANRDTTALRDAKESKE